DSARRATKAGCVALALMVAVFAPSALAQTETIAYPRVEVPAGAARLKDVAGLAGAFETPLVGYGLVVGLNKTGDKRQTIFSAQTLAKMLERFGIPGAAVRV